MCVSVRACVQACVHAQLCMCMCMRACACVCACTHVHVCVCVCETREKDIKKDKLSHFEISVVVSFCPTLNQAGGNKKANKNYIKDLAWA